MRSSVFDSEIYRDIFTTGEMSAVFSDDRLIAYWLKFEVELAAAQAELGIIPADAAAEIAAAAQPERIDRTELRAGIAEVGRPIEPLLRQVAAGNDQVKEYLHWGSTTQDVMDTATVLQIKDAIVLVERDLKSLLRALADKAEAYRATPMMARTNGQDANPTSFGYMLASYMTELHRNFDRLRAAAARVCVGQCGSAVGTLSAMGGKGLEVRALLMQRLGLGEPDMSWNASRDNYAEIVLVLSLIHGTTGRIAADMNLWSRMADGIVDEGQDGQGGASSTLPHKRNPRSAEIMAGLAYLAEIRSAGAGTMLHQSETRQGGPWISEWSTIPEMFMLTAATLVRGAALFRRLIVFPDRMLAAFDDSHGFVMTEPLMMAIAPKIGRKQAYDLIKAEIKRGKDALSFRALIEGSAALSRLIDGADLEAILDPGNYLGLAPAMVDQAVARVRALEF